MRIKISGDLRILEFEYFGRCEKDFLVVVCLLEDLPIHQTSSYFDILSACSGCQYCNHRTKILGIHRSELCRFYPIRTLYVA